MRGGRCCRRGITWSVFAPGQPARLVETAVKTISANLAYDVKQGSDKTWQGRVYALRNGSWVLTGMTSRYGSEARARSAALALAGNGSRA
jgi:hypothetical protein